MKNRLTLAVTLAGFALGLANRANASGWTAVSPAPGGVSTMMLLSDGTVMAQAGGGTGWYRLTPDSAGHYYDGTWTSDINPMTYSRTYFASDILQNGKVFVAGGELSGSSSANGTAWVEIYDPVANSWTDYGPAYFGGMADAESVVLKNGQVLVNPQASSGYGADTFVFNPADGSFTAKAPLNSLSESCWVKMPDDSILTVDSDRSVYGAYTSEKYVPGGAGGWVNASSTLLPVSIWATFPVGRIVGETGPAFLLPNGNAIFFGGTGHTAIYVASSATWIAGPDIPNGQVSADAPGAMMVNGKILLCVCAPLSDNADPNNPSDWPVPVSFYEYDYSVGATGAFTRLNSTDNVSLTRNDRSYPCRMLDLPDGTVLFTDGGSQLYVYQPDSGALAAGRPTINSITWNNNGSLHLTGTLFNGISEGAAYGDDQQMATDFPLVRFTDGSGNVSYGRTYNWSSTSVQTGGQIMSTEATLPPGIFPGNYSVQVVANGNASAPVAFYSPVWVDFNYYSFFNFYFGWYIYPDNTLASGVSTVANGGTIAIKSSNSHETMTISKPMTIISVSGAATIGH